MLQMTQHINADWKSHVAQTGVTCYTCHRGQPVPANVWFNARRMPPQTRGMLGNTAGQNAPAMPVGLTSLPLRSVLGLHRRRGRHPRRLADGAAEQRQSVDRSSRPSATYGLMIHMSKALGVNCTYCHNTRSFASWEMSTPQRVDCVATASGWRAT